MNYVKLGWCRIKDSIDSIEELYTIQECKQILMTNNFYLQFQGKGKSRTLIKKYPKLYKSIYTHTSNLEIAMKKQKSYKWSYGFMRRIEFIINHDCNLYNLKCKCGKKFTWTLYCRQCPEPKKTWLGRNHSAETRLKMRNTTLNLIHQHYGQVTPRYNKASIIVLEETARQYQIDDLIHAENGGEYKVLGYHVDGYSPSKNIVIEYDEKHHYTKNGKLRKKDKIRQREIEKFLGCKFIRIRETNVN